MPMETLKTISPRQIEEQEMQLLQAMQTSDIALLDQLIHPQLQFTTPTGQVVTKTMDLENYRSGSMTIAAMSPSDQKIQIIGQDAIVTVKIDMEGEFLGQAFKGAFRFTRFWKLVDNQWQVVGGSSVQINA
ncbi:MAG TPA: DUF4440 domain-containing protein [Microscillaceae bacterium]|nr:DUF4440 domain-containing protein [Microscillaceae bacterium]